MSLRTEIEIIIAGLSSPSPAYVYERIDIMNLLFDSEIMPVIGMQEYDSGNKYFIGNRLIKTKLITIIFADKAEHEDDATTNDIILQQQDAISDQFIIDFKKSNLFIIPDRFQDGIIKETRFDACLIGVSLTFETALINGVISC